MTDAPGIQFSATNFRKKRKENKREDGGREEQRWEERARQKNQNRRKREHEKRMCMNQKTEFNAKHNGLPGKMLQR
jgi:hypothetical protein